MSNPFKKPKTPDPEPEPKRKDPAVQEARRRAVLQARQRRGFLATILSDLGTTGGGASVLGAA